MRVKKLINSQLTTVYHYDEMGNILQETDEDGNILATYIYANGQRIAKVRGFEIIYYHNDVLGSPVLLMDNSGEVVHLYHFGPFGNIEAAKGTSGNKYRFTGKEQDETGMYYFGARYYDPMVGRFITPDPVMGISPQLLNPYPYCQNNPILYVDPTGEWVWLVAFMAIGALAGGGVAYAMGYRPNDWQFWAMVGVGAFLGYGAYEGWFAFEITLQGVPIISMSSTGGGITLTILGGIAVYEWVPEKEPTEKHLEAIDITEEMESWEEIESIRTETYKEWLAGQKKPGRLDGFYGIRYYLAGYEEIIGMGGHPAAFHPGKNAIYYRRDVWIKFKQMSEEGLCNMRYITAHEFFHALDFFNNVSGDPEIRARQMQIHYPPMLPPIIIRGRRIR
jgi:RHS repeat-associated protein